MSKLKLALLSQEDLSSYDTDKRIEGDEQTQIREQDDPKEEVRDELPEIGNMRVDEVMQEQQTQDEVMQRQVSSATRLQAIAEVVTECYKNGTFNSGVYNVAKVALLNEGVVQKSLSMESNKEDLYKITMEGFMDTIKSIVKQIIDFFKKSIDWITQFFRGLNLKTYVSQLEILKLIDSIKENRDRIRSIKNNNTNIFLSEKFMQFEYIADPYLANALKIDNVNVDSYNDALRNILYLINHNAATKSEWVCGVMPQYAHELLSSDFEKIIDAYTSGSFKDIMILAKDPHSLCHPECNNATMQMGSADTHKTEINSLKAEDSTVFHIQTKLFGNYHVVHQYNKDLMHFHNNHNKIIKMSKMLEYMSDWKIFIAKIDPTSGKNDGYLRNIGYDELDKIHMTFKAIYKSLGDYDKTIESSNLFKKKLIVYLEQMRDAVKEISLEEEFNNGQISAGAVLSASKSIRQINDHYLSSKYIFVLKIMDYWKLYLDAILQKEKSIL